MRASAVIALIVLAGLAILPTAWVIFRLPLIPNRAFFGAVCARVSLAYEGFAMLLARRHLNGPSPTTLSWLHIFPAWLSVFGLSWSCFRSTTEKKLSLDFSHGVDVEKHRSRNHGYWKSLRVEVDGGDTLEVKGISTAMWEMISSGSQVCKRRDSLDITIDQR